MRAQADKARSKDHPRSRGEYVATGYGDTLPSGSSPLSRGIHAREPAPTQPLWIIPALAGNTAMMYATWVAAKDHPRSRGEYCPSIYRPTRGLGSSPLSRGIHFQTIRKPLGMGIIPALAGNTTPERQSNLQERDHPRSRGEYSADSTGPKVQAGIIPALAGNTAK